MFIVCDITMMSIMTLCSNVSELYPQEKSLFEGAESGEEGQGGHDNSEWERLLREGEITPFAAPQ